MESFRSHHAVEDVISHRAKRATGSCMKKSLCNRVPICAALKSVEVIGLTAPTAKPLMLLMNFFLSPTHERFFGMLVVMQAEEPVYRICCLIGGCCAGSVASYSAVGEGSCLRKMSAFMISKKIWSEQVGCQLHTYHHGILSDLES